MENIEQKQLIRLRKREEYKIRPLLVKLRDEDAAKENPVRVQRLLFSEQYAEIFISKDLSRVESQKNLIKELKELKENETEGECYKIKNGENCKRKDRKIERARWKWEKLQRRKRGEGEGIWSEREIGKGERGKGG